MSNEVLSIFQDLYSHIIKIKNILYRKRCYIFTSSHALFDDLYSSFVAFSIPFLRGNIAIRLLINR